jgi:hypothetical protein
MVRTTTATAGASIASEAVDWQRQQAAVDALALERAARRGSDPTHPILRATLSCCEARLREVRLRPDVLATDAEFVAVLHEAMQGPPPDAGTLTVWSIVIEELARLRRTMAPTPLIDGGFHA